MQFGAGRQCQEALQKPPPAGTAALVEQNLGMVGMMFKTLVPIAAAPMPGDKPITMADAGPVSTDAAICRHPDITMTLAVSPA